MKFSPDFLSALNRSLFLPESAAEFIQKRLMSARILVGKVEAGIPEDDVRNPATIADNVGDNVGDVAGMGADLFGSYVATILATMVFGREIIVTDNFNGLSPMLLPMLIAGLGIIFSIIGFSLVQN